MRARTGAPAQDAARATRVRQDLGAVGAACGPTRSELIVPRWGALLAALATSCDAASDDYVAGLELIYEGYLEHYREGRVTAPPSGPEAALLCGDVFYARGLRRFAARGDVAAVALLTRLMASCAGLRSAGAPFAADDALWAYAVGGLAALPRGAQPDRVARLFDEIDAALGAGELPDVRAAARAAAPALGLPDPAPLADELRGAASPSAPDATQHTSPDATRPATAQGGPAGAEVCG